jgi:hypothetical protein
MSLVKSILPVAGLVFSLGAGTLNAGTGADGYFQLYNDTAGNVLVGFYTNDGNGWSPNWIEGIEISPGDNGQASFNADTGACEQVFQAGWKGEDGSEVFDDPISIDICDASNVYLGDNEISFD